MSEPTGSSPKAGRLLVRRYELVERIAMGGMAEVWRGTDRILNRPVAIKMLHPHLANDSVLVERFRAEALAVARLSHPGIVSIFDTISDDGLAAIIMELVPGNNLRDELQQRGVLPIPQAVRVAAAIADALSVAHAADVVHRDIKPANILLCPDGRVMIADFGIAKVTASEALTVAGTMLGTAGYLSPEQVEGRPTNERSDIYALGILLFEMLTGELPFGGESDAALALARLHTDPVPPSEIRPGVPERLDHITLKALARDPDDRYQNAASMCDSLLGQRTGQRPVPVASRSESRQMATSRPSHNIATDRASNAAQPNHRHHGQPKLLKPLLVGLVSAAVLVAGLLVIRSPGVGPKPTGGALLDIAAVTEFDPAPGDNREHHDELRNMLDNNPNTTWSTESYKSQTFGNKSGVGFILELSSVKKLTKLSIASASSGWAVSIYVASSTPSQTLDGWGSAVATNAEISGNASLDLKSTPGRLVLVWITKLGTMSAPFSVRIASVDLFAK